MKKVLKAQDVEFCYTVEGSGSKAVILMHGWGCNHTTLASIERLLTDSFTVYNVDFPGFGDSTEPPSVWGMEQYTAIVEKLVQAEHIDNPILMGHSFGGRVGIMYASRNKVAKLVLIDAAGVKPRRSLKYYFKIYKPKHQAPDLEDDYCEYEEEAPEEVVEDYEETADEDTPPWDEDGKEDEH